MEQYVKLWRSRGYSSRQLYDYLVGFGNDPKAVTEALKKSDPRKPKDSHKSILVIGLVVFIFLGMIIGAYAIWIAGGGGECGDGILDPGETPGNCCRDAGCGSGMTCQGGTCVSTAVCGYCQYSSGGVCVDYPCCGDLDCDDSDIKTTDACVDAGTEYARCVNTRSIELGETSRQVTLTLGESVSFMLGNDSHVLEVEGVQSDSVTLVVYSEPIRFSIEIGQAAHVDVDRDGLDDIEIRLTAIVGGLPQMRVRLLSAVDRWDTLPPSVPPTDTGDENQSVDDLPDGDAVEVDHNGRALVLRIDTPKTVYQVGESVSGSYSILYEGERFDAVVVYVQGREGFDDHYRVRRIPIMSAYAYETLTPQYASLISPTVGLRAFRLDEDGYLPVTDSFAEPGRYFVRMLVYDCQQIASNLLGIYNKDCLDATPQELVQLGPIETVTRFLEVYGEAETSHCDVHADCIGECDYCVSGKEICDAQSDRCVQCTSDAHCDADFRCVQSECFHWYCEAREDECLDDLQDYLGERLDLSIVPDLESYKAGDVVSGTYEIDYEGIPFDALVVHRMRREGFASQTAFDRHLTIRTREEFARLPTNLKKVHALEFPLTAFHIDATLAVPSSTTFYDAGIYTYALEVYDCVTLEAELDEECREIDLDDLAGVGPVKSVELTMTIDEPEIPKECTTDTDCTQSCPGCLGGSWSCAIDYTCEACSADAHCAAGHACREGDCVQWQCDRDSDCLDGNLATSETCSNYQCSSVPKTACVLGDYYCPPGCTAQNDFDCASPCANETVDCGISESLNNCWITAAANCCPASIRIEREDAIGDEGLMLFWSKDQSLEGFESERCKESGQFTEPEYLFYTQDARQELLDSGMTEQEIVESLVFWDLLVETATGTDWTCYYPMDELDDELLAEYGAYQTGDVQADGGAEEDWHRRLCEGTYEQWAETYAWI